MRQQVLWVACVWFVAWGVAEAQADGKFYSFKEVLARAAAAGGPPDQSKTQEANIIMVPLKGCRPGARKDRAGRCRPMF